MIIGLTGTLRAGKGTLVDLFKEKGFEHFSFRRYLEERGAKNRDEMVDLANKLRAEYGPSYIAEQLFEQAEKSGNSVIESLRTPGEVDALRKKGNFYLIAVDAPIGVRYDRAQKTASSTDNIPFEKFKADELREMTSEDPNKQNISACMEGTDYFFWNNYDSAGIAKSEFATGKDGFLNLFDENYRISPRRPTFDEIFMRQAHEWSHKSACLSRHTGAIIVDDKTLISQGYNGPPRNIKHCEDRGGCIRKKMDIPSGERLDLCFAAHAEANAIWNAGRNGRSVIGTIMYATTFPCKDCAIGIIQSGIRKVIYFGAYKSELAEKILREAGIEMQRYRHGVSPTLYSKLWI